MAEKSVYHHGDLRNALLDAALEELKHTGPEKFSLRGCAKRAGVSHAAPAHHFKDTQALLQAVAAQGFERLAEALRQNQAGADAPKPQLVAVGTAYVSFAIENHALFSLMFGGHASDVKDEALRKNADAAFSIFVNCVGKLRGSAAFQTEAGWRDVTAIWSMVHGYAQLSAANKMGYVTQRPFEEQRPYIEDMLNRIVG